MYQRVGMAVLIFWVSTVGASIVLAQEFHSSTARIATGNLGGFSPIPDGRIDQQVDRFKILDAEVIALVEVYPVTVMDRLKAKLAEAGLEYEPVPFHVLEPVPFNLPDLTNNHEQLDLDRHGRTPVLRVLF
jgi:hypothetical protein